MFLSHNKSAGTVFWFFFSEANGPCEADRAPARKAQGFRYVGIACNCKFPGHGPLWIPVRSNAAATRSPGRRKAHALPTCRKHGLVPAFPFLGHGLQLVVGREALRTKQEMTRSGDLHLLPLAVVNPSCRHDPVYQTACRLKTAGNAETRPSAIIKDPHLMSTCSHLPSVPIPIGSSEIRSHN